MKWRSPHDTGKSQALLIMSYSREVQTCTDLLTKTPTPSSPVGKRLIPIVKKRKKRGEERKLCSDSCGECGLVRLTFIWLFEDESICLRASVIKASCLRAEEAGS